jgi:hypothetical protein
VRRPLVASGLVLLLAAGLVSCSDDDDASDQVVDTTTTTEEDEESTTSTSTSTTSTTMFDGAVTPTSIASTADRVALLTAVDVVTEEPVDRVTFTFRDGVVPGVDAGYVTPPIRSDGSGDPVEVEGATFLSIRLEPASGVDLSGSEAEQTYTGPSRITGSWTNVTEVVRTGDFEANLTWVIGLGATEPSAYRVEATDGRVVVTIFNAG